MLRRGARSPSSRLAALLIGAVVPGATGHLVLHLLNLDLAHHVFHLVFPLVALLVFVALVARDVRQHGWPTFSWRLTPTTPPRATRR